MAMRPFAPSALLLAAVVGCGVPETPLPKADVVTATTAGEPVKPKKPEPTTPTTPVQAAEQDPAKLGEKVIDGKVGTGVACEPGDTCVMKYAGRLKSNNQEFDSNMKGDKPPFSFTLGSGQVIKGWDVGVRGMKVGGKRTLQIPSALGYGAQGGGDKIPPNSDLVFDIELVDVQKAADAGTVVRQTVKPGSGPEVKAGDVVTIKYKATLSDGKVVDDNGGKPIQFKVGDPAVAIPGLNLALEGMRPGQVANATIPPALGYRGPSMGRTVPPNSTLKMEITLVKVG